MKWILSFTAILAVLLALYIAYLSPTARMASAEPSPSPEPKTLLIRADDLGFAHGKNIAIKELIETGMPVSVSVMFASPWWKDAVDILSEHPDVSVGVHLTLNSEWHELRWGPILGRSVVPSLVDEDGHFFPSRASLFANNPSLNEIEMELRAQIERAVNSGLQIDYLDHHMGAAVQTPETRAIVEKLAREFGLGISRYFGEDVSNVTYSAPLGAKTDSLVERINRLQPDVVNVQVVHVSHKTPEMLALTDRNPFGPPDMAEQRYGELQALLSRQFRDALQRNNVTLITYRDLIRHRGLESMKAP